MVPTFQLSSANLRIELRSVSVWSTLPSLANGEITTTGWRGARPGRPRRPPPAGGSALLATEACAVGRPALTGTGEEVEQRRRVFGHAAEREVVPAVRVVVGDD